MTKKLRRLEAQRVSLDLPAFAMEARPMHCHLEGYAHPASHWLSVHETLVPCRVTMP